MDNESQVIQRQMEETRSSLQDKLETLEQQVKNTVQDATEAVSDTVESVKDAVQDTVDTVKDTVQGTVQSVKESFDFAQHIQTHPWTMFFGATAVGFVATRWLAREADHTPSATTQHEPMAAAPVHGGGPPPNLASRPVTSKAGPGIGSWIAEHYQGELAKVKGLAIGALGGLVRDMLVSMASPTISSKVKEIANDFTGKLGGQVFEGPIWTPTAARDESADLEQDWKTPRADVERPLGAVCE